MSTTRASLLIRIKNPRDTDAWAQFHDLYAPILYKYARARGLNRTDAEDVRSRCYEAIVQQIKTFDYDKAKGGFKAWLRTMTDRRVIDLLRKRRDRQAASGVFKRLPDAQPAPEELWEQEWKNRHLKYCLEQLRGEVSTRTFEAFTMVVLEGRSVSETCDELGMSPNQVYKTRARVLQRVRRKMVEIGYEDIEC